MIAPVIAVAFVRLVSCCLEFDVTCSTGNFVEYLTHVLSIISLGPRESLEKHTGQFEMII